MLHLSTLRQNLLLGQFTVVVHGQHDHVQQPRPNPPPLTLEGDTEDQEGKTARPHIYSAFQRRGRTKNPCRCFTAPGFLLYFLLPEFLNL